MKIAIIDYGSGNIKSLYNSLSFLNYTPIITSNSKEINNCDKIILPGVGSFDNCISKINAKLDIENLKNEILFKKKFFLGICVGMQILSTFGFENKKMNGLNLIEGVVEKINCKPLALPHVGWNNIEIIKKDEIFNGIESFLDFYFVHSYRFKVVNREYSLAETIYGEKFSSVIKRENIYGVQFHPEKSQSYGLKFLSNFLKL